MGRRGMHIKFWFESLKERDHEEYLDVRERIILRWIVGKWDGVYWNEFIWLWIGTSGVFW
jgi:hypothetical protein